MSFFNFFSNAITSGDLSFTIDNSTAIADFRITSVVVSASSTDLCGKNKITITTSSDFINYFYAANSVDVAPTSILELDHDRELDLFLILNTSAIISQNQSIEYPLSTNPKTISGNPSGLPIVPGQIVNIPSLTSQKININTTPTINGGTVIIGVSDSNGLIFTYSLNNITFQASSTFTGQAAGNYTIYVKDQYGCVKSKDFTVTAAGLKDPIAYISKANSISFIKEEVVDNINVFKNNGNSFDYQDFGATNYCENILFNKSNKVATQIKTNYETVTVTLRREIGSDVNIIPIRRTGNLGRFDDLDCKIYRHSSGKMGVYFESGNRYDQGSVVIEQYTLNGNLPDFAVIGNQVNIFNFGNFNIIDVVLDRTIQKRVMLMDTGYTGALINGRARSIFDILPFEVWEFDIDWSLYNVGLHDVTVVFTDPNYDTVNMVSENIDVQVNHENILTTIYSNDKANNKDIFYKYGITHIMLVPYLSISASVKDETTVNMTDDSTYIINSELNESDDFSFGEVTRSGLRRLSIALGSDNLFINGIGRSKDGGLSVENIENTNMYTIECTLIDNNVRYTNFRNEDTGFDADYTDLLIPSLLNINGDFLKI